MADSNMTVGAVTGETQANGKMSRIRKVTFSHTAHTTAAGNATTPFTICGELLRVETTGGDADWDIILNDGDTDIWTFEVVTATATSYPLYMTAASGIFTDHLSTFAIGIPMCGQLLCTTAGVSTANPTITVYWREDE